VDRWESFDHTTRKVRKLADGSSDDDD